jgi:hypothetical protein
MKDISRPKFERSFLAESYRGVLPLVPGTGAGREGDEGSFRSDLFGCVSLSSLCGSPFAFAQPLPVFVLELRLNDLTLSLDSNFPFFIRIS